MHPLKGFSAKEANEEDLLRGDWLRLGEREAKVDC